MILGRRERILVFPVYKTFMLHLQGLLKLMENAQCYLLKEPEDRIQWAIATTEIWGGKTPEKEKIRKKEPQILCVTLPKSLEAQLKLKELNRDLRGYPQQGNRVWYFAFNQINCLLLKKKKKLQVFPYWTYQSRAKLICVMRVSFPSVLFLSHFCSLTFYIPPSANSLRYFLKPPFILLQTRQNLLFLLLPCFSVITYKEQKHTENSSSIKKKLFKVNNHSKHRNSRQLKEVMQRKLGLVTKSSGLEKGRNFSF